MNYNIITQLKKKALQSDCRYKVSAIGFNKKGDQICCINNQHRFSKYGGGIHAEMRIMANYNVSDIIIARVSNNGKFLPIHPCKICQKTANKLNIKISTII